MDGWLVIDKPQGPSSAQVVGKVKWMFKQAGMKLAKIGHAGTLDPLATGVLPLALGEATKTVAYMLEADKAYEFTVVFGVQTSSDDAAGEVVATRAGRPTAAEISAVLGQFTGPISQMPPAVSALKVDGERAYDLVRRGETPALKARDVVVHKLEFQGVEGDVARFYAHVSKGTYIRSLARDMALALGTVGHVGSLRRVLHGPFGVAEATTLEQLDMCLKSGQTAPILPVERALHGLVAYPLTSGQAQALRQGRVIPATGWQAGLAYTTEQDRLVAIIQVDEAGTAHPQRVFIMQGT